MPKVNPQPAVDPRPKQGPRRRGLNLRLIPRYVNNNNVIFANVTRFTHVGTDVILDIGVLDDQKFIQAMQEQGEGTDDSDTPPIDAFITHRIGFGLQTLLKLKENLDDIVSKMIEAGIVEGAQEAEK